MILHVLSHASTGRDYPLRKGRKVADVFVSASALKGMDVGTVCSTHFCVQPYSYLRYIGVVCLPVYLFVVYICSIGRLYA